jgi:aryl-alcohol dehydrogenase-like predicted oxidoreductase
VQPRYNLIDREDYERELEPMVREFGIGVICYSSLASGFLSGKYRRDAALPESKRAGGIQGRYMHDRGFAVIDKVLAAAQTTGATPTQVAIAWLLQRPSITAPIVSATSVAQVEELCGAIGVSLDGVDL